MDKIKIVLIVLAVFIFATTGYFLYKANNTIEQQNNTIIELQNQVDLLNVQESVVNVLTTSTDIARGTAVNDLVLDYVQIPEMIYSNEYITDYEEIKHQLWKIDVAAGTIITKSMLNKEYLTQSDRKNIIAVDYITPSLKAGDYVDIIIKTPTGIKFKALNKKRVINVYDQSLEIVLNDVENLIYEDLIRMKSLNRGTLLSAESYLDPAIQKKTYSTYVPSIEVLEFMAIDRNIPLFPYSDESNYLDMRKYIESCFPYYVYGDKGYNNSLQQVKDRDGMLAAGNEMLSSRYNEARREYKERLGQQGISLSTGSESLISTQDSYSKTGGAGYVNKDTYVDDEGVERYPDGSAVSASQEVINDYNNNYNNSYLDDEDEDNHYYINEDEELNP